MVSNPQIRSLTMKKLLILSIILLAGLNAFAGKRYFIGTSGAKNWNTTAVWSTSSGGATGAAMPTSSDTVYVDAASWAGSGSITLDAVGNCAGIDFTGLDQAVSFLSTTNSLNVYGGITLAANLTWTFSGTAYVYSKGTGTIMTNGVVPEWNRWYIDGAGITVTNGDDANLGATAIYLANGTLDINDKILTKVSVFNTEIGTKALMLGSGTFSLARWSNSVPTGFTFSPETGTVNITRTASSTYVGADTFYNLTFSGGSGFAGLEIRNSITVTNILTISGSNSGNFRFFVSSSTIGTPRTITCNGTVNITNADLQDITIAGTAAPYTAGATVGDCGGNSGVNFVSPISCYYKGTSGAHNYSDATKWFTSDGGSVQSRFPLPQDAAYVTANSFSGASTLTVDVPRIGSIDLSGCEDALSWTLANAISCYGNYVLGSNVTQSGNFETKVLPRVNGIINAYDKTIYYLHIHSFFGKTITLMSNSINTYFYINATQITAYNGIVDLNDYNVNCLRVYWAGSTIRMGNGSITCLASDGNDPFASISNTIITENSSIIISPSSGSNNIKFLGGGQSFNIVQFSGSHAGNFIIIGSNTFKELKIDSGRKVQVTAGTNQTVTKLTARGTPIAPITLQSTTTTPATITYTGETPGKVQYCNISYLTMAPSKYPMYASESKNVAGNTGWIFQNFMYGEKPIRFYEYQKPQSLKENGLIYAMNGTRQGNSVADISDNGQTGTITGNVIQNKDGLQFFGTNGKVSMTGNSGLTGDITIATRVKVTGISANSRIFDGGGYIYFYPAPSTGNLILSRNGGSKGAVAANATSILNQWVDVIVTSTSVGITNIYINGVLSGSANQDAGTPVSGTAWVIGNRSANDRPFHGTISDLRIYNRILSTNEIKAYHNSFVRPYIVEDFSSNPVGQAVPKGWIKGTGVYSVQENSTRVTSGPLVFDRGTKYLSCTTAGTIAFPSKQAYGTWEWDWFKGGDANGLFIQFIAPKYLFNYSTSIGGYDFRITTSEAVGLIKTAVSTLAATANSYISNSTWYRFRITRTTAGVFTVLIKGGTFTPTVGYDGWTLVSTSGGSGTNPVTDNTYTSSQYFVLDLDAGDRIANIKMFNDIKQ